MILRTIELPIELTNNNTGRTQHFGRSASQRKKYERIIRAKFGQQVPFSSKVEIVVQRVLAARQRLWDESSILRGNWKEIEDALVACGFLHDDKPDYVAKCVGDQDAITRLTSVGGFVRVYFLDIGTLNIKSVLQMGLADE
jgi:hypothetical protein